MKIKRSKIALVAIVASFASLGSICPTAYDRMQGKPIILNDLVIEYRESVSSSAIARVQVGELGRDICWWYLGKNFVFSGTVNIERYSVRQLTDEQEIRKAEAKVTGYLYYEHGNFYYSYHANASQQCPMDDPGIAAIDYARAKFFLFSFAFIALFPFCKLCGKSITGMIRRLGRRNEKLRRSVSMILIFAICLPSSVALLAIIRGGKIFASLFYHWIFTCPEGHGTPGFEAYNLLLVPLGFAFIFAVIDLGLFYSKLLDVFIPSIIFGLVCMFFGAGLIMILCNPAVMTIVILGFIIALVLSFYLWLEEGI